MPALKALGKAFKKFEFCSTFFIAMVVLGSPLFIWGGIVVLTLALLFDGCYYPLYGLYLFLIWRAERKRWKRREWKEVKAARLEERRERNRDKELELKKVEEQAKIAAEELDKRQREDAEKAKPKPTKGELLLKAKEEFEEELTEIALITDEDLRDLEEAKASKRYRDQCMKIRRG